MTLIDFQNALQERSKIFNERVEEVTNLIASVGDIEYSEHPFEISASLAESLTKTLLSTEGNGSQGIAPTDSVTVDLCNLEKKSFSNIDFLKALASLEFKENKSFKSGNALYSCDLYRSNCLINNLALELDIYYPDNSRVATSALFSTSSPSEEA